MMIYIFWLGMIYCIQVGERRFSIGFFKRYTETKGNTMSQGLLAWVSGMVVPGYSTEFWVRK